MNKFYLFFIILMVFIGTPCLRAVSLTNTEVKLVNDISVYLDVKPTGHALKFCKHAAESESVVLRGLALVILNKHFCCSYEPLLLKSFTLNVKNDQFEQDKKVRVKIDNLERLLEPFDLMLNQITDERVRGLFLFYHFRHKNVALLGVDQEELGLAEFYRLAFLSVVFEDEKNVKKLIEKADR